MKEKTEKARGTSLEGMTISIRAEQKQVEERVAMGANRVYEAIRREGDDELHRPPLWRGRPSPPVTPWDFRSLRRQSRPNS